ncbi:MAG: TIGR03016 family PEP-CTERM system-associated outer membrane protein [Thiobacillus sp.]|nr:TIGR03016 family PEP-CTERM system-associated outer membrane protein [Thiobacillus sp.]
MAFAFSTAAHALDWRFSPSVGARATYTDNANQSDTDPQDELSLSVTPGFSLMSVGSRRVTASLSYTLTGTSRFGENNSSDVYHGLGALGRAELVDDLLFVEGTANVSQSLVSLFGSPADATVNDSNRVTTGVYSLSPSLIKRFGTFATAQARYTVGGAIFGDNAASDSTTQAFSAGLASGTRFNDLSWGLNYSIRKADNSGGTRDTTFERASLSLGYALTRKFRVFGTYGKEWNDFLSANNQDGTSYSVGFGWSPNQRTSLEASVGERYFGRTYGVSGTYRTRATQWSLRYSEDVSDITQQLLQDSGRIFWVCNNRLFETQDFTPPAGQTNCSEPYSGFQIARSLAQLGVPLSDLVALGLVDIALNNGIYVIKSLNGGVSWQIGPRTSLGVSIFDTRRLYQAISNAEDRSQGVNGTVSYRLTPRSTANGSLGFTRNSATSALLSAPARADNTATLNLGVNHQFGKDLSGALNFRHQQRDSNAANADFTENSLSASVSMRF